MKRGFTILEILLTITVIAILVTIVIVAINPGRQMAGARNSARASSINQLQKAINQYLIEHGNYPASFSEIDLSQNPDPCDGESNENFICAQGESENCVDLSPLIPTYLASLPQDPASSTETHTGYCIYVNDDTSKMEIKASLAELGEIITTDKSEEAQNLITLSTGLISHLKMNSNLSDASGNGNDGSIGGNTNYSTGRFDQGASLTEVLTLLLLIMILH